MRKFTALLLIFLLLCTCGCRWGGNNTEHVDTFTQPDYLSLIRQDLFSEKTVITEAMAETVILYLDEVTEQSVTVTVVAPDVCQEALSWFNTVSEEEYSDEALEEKLLELMNGEMLESQFVLDVYGEEIYYTEEFLDATSCGVRDFYGKLTAMVIAEMEANLDA